MTWRRVIFGSVAAPCLVLVLLVLLVVFCAKPDLYGATTFSTAVTDRNGVLLRIELADDDRYRLKTALAEIAPTAVAATLLYEDRWFESHVGFNIGALLRAAWTTYVQRDRAVGGSTITMQLARLRFGLDTRSVRGKLVQIARAVQLERHYTKDAILEAYLNLAPYGGNIEGIGTASLIYFDKPASQLSLPEALALAVVPQNPVKRAPATPNGMAQTLSARARLASLWADEYGLTETQAAQASLPLVARATSRLPYRAPHFSRHLGSYARADRSVVRTSLDVGIQTTLEQRLQRYVERKRNVGIRNASAMLVDFRSMQVVASVGSAAFFDTAIAGQVDGTRAKRSPGSTLKPFVYGLAMDQGLIHPMSMLKDAPKRFAAYAPENFDRGFMGPVFARDALVYSRNVPAIDLLARVGHERFHAFLEDGGVADLRAPDHYGLAMVLGGNELTMHELVRLYAMLANDGFARPLIMRPDDTAKQGHRLLSAEASYLVLDMLRESRRPDALALEDRRDTPAIAWKTGTSYAYRDAWTVGVFGPYVLAVWVGNFDGASNPALVGRTAAAPLFFEIADALRAQQAMNPLPSRPEPHLNLIQVDVCASTGDLPGRHCPETRPSWFIPGISPIRVSDVHRAIRIDNRTGERACQTDIEETHEAVYEFWSSDVLQLFQKAGVARRQPPPWAAGCSLDVLAASGAPPTITAPTAHLEYQLPLTGTQHERFALQATADADVQWLYWFANDRFIAKAPRDETVFWRPTPGHYQMLVVDDLGRSDTTSLQIASVQ